MKAYEFCYWLQGLLELQDPTSLNEAQTQKIKNHLNMVFLHDIDKSYPETDKLNVIHGKTNIDGLVMRC